jgi:hypothetical protein
MLAFSDGDPIWVPVGDESGDSAAELALSDADGRVLLADKGAWLTIGTYNYGPHWFLDEVNVVRFQATEPTSRKCIFKHYSKKDVETLVSITMDHICIGGNVPKSDMDRMLKDETILMYKTYMRLLE